MLIETVRGIINYNYTMCCLCMGTHIKPQECPLPALDKATWSVHAVVKHRLNQSLANCINSL